MPTATKPKEDKATKPAPAVKPAAKQEEPIKAPPGSIEALDGNQAAESVETKVSRLERLVEVLELRLASTVGFDTSPAEKQQRLERIMARQDAFRMKGGRHEWRIHNDRYKDRNGEPVAFPYWSDLLDPKEVVAEFRRRTKSTWNVTEGRDPLSAELIKADSRPADWDAPLK